MRFNRIDLNLLVALDALLSERNVTRAGEKLFLSQSAMSGALARLRAHFEDELIVRAGREMLLTPFAEGLIDPVRDLLLRTGAVLERRSAFDPATAERHFRIAASDFVIGQFLPGLVREIEAAAPRVTLEIYDATGQDAGITLEKGETDLLVVPRGRAAADHPSADLFRDDWCVLAAAGNRLPSPLDLETYLRAGHIAVNFGRGRRPGIVERRLTELGLERNVAVWASSYHLVPAMVAGTGRIATTPARLARRAVTLLDLAVHASPVAFPAIDEVVQWNRHHDAEPGLNWLKKMLIGVAEAFEPRLP